MENQTNSKWFNKTLKFIWGITVIKVYYLANA
jgi:hypothetical protein